MDLRMLALKFVKIANRRIVIHIVEFIEAARRKRIIAGTDGRGDALSGQCGGQE